MVSDSLRAEIPGQVKEQADIVQIIGECVALKRSGTRYLGLCPFHGEKTPSFSVHAGQQFYHCFGCGESGDVFSFVMKYHGVDFPRALKMVADRYHIALPEKRRSPEQEKLDRKRELLFKVNEKAARLFEKYLLGSPGAGSAREYLRKRGISGEIAARYRIGYAPAVESEGWNFLGSSLQGAEFTAGVEAGLLVKKEHGGSYDRFRDRVVFPIMNVSGRICGFGGRILGQGQPKYLNSPESPVFNKGNLLLGLFQHKDELRKQNRAIIVEGNFDLISLAAQGVSNVVAPLGTALTREQLRLVRRYSDEVVLLFDGDEAGIRAATRSAPLFLAEQISGRVALLPAGHDPDTYVLEHGAAKLRQLVDAAEELPEFVIGGWIETYGLGFDGKRKIIAELKPLMDAAGSSRHRSLFLSHLAEKLGLEKEELGRMLNLKSSAGPEPAGPARQAAVGRERMTPLSLPQRQLVEFMVLQPASFTTLDGEGLRSSLEGSVGEVIYLQLKSVLQENPGAEPEDFLTAFLPGPERLLVSEILSGAGAKAEDEREDQSRQELSDLLDYLRKAKLQKRISDIMVELKKAQDAGDSRLMAELMLEQVSVSRKIHGEEG